MSEFPKWVVPHESHVIRLGGRDPMAPAFPQSHVDRSGALTVLVDDADAESAALAPEASVEAAEEAPLPEADPVKPVEPHNDKEIQP